MTLTVYDGPVTQADVQQPAETAKSRGRLGSSPTSAAHGQPTPPRTTIERLRNAMPADSQLAWTVALVITGFAFILRMVGLDYPNKLLFDETYYAKDAWSVINFGYERSWGDSKVVDAQLIAGNFSGLKESGSFIVHPPLGKLLIGIGIKLFGFNGLGFRISSVVFGCATIMVLIFLTRRVARSTLIGGLAGLLLSLDGLNFVMSRLALLDIFQAFFCVLGVSLLVLDRDWFRERLARHLETHGLTDLGGRFGPLVWWRPWRLAAGVTFGLGCAVKWNSIYVLAAFSLLSVCWDFGARRLAGAGRGAWRSLVTDAPIAFVYQVPVAALVYLASWSGWLATTGAYNRDWGDKHPDERSVHLLGKPLASLLDYHEQIFAFHTGDSLKHVQHPYRADPGGWLFMARPTGVDAVNSIPAGTGGCPVGGETCQRVISAMGTPLLWWVGLAALVASVVLWLLARDWRFAIPVLGVASTWLTWFPNSERPLFFFYAVVIIPFTCMAVALCAGLVIGPASAPRHRHLGSIIVGVVVALIAIDFAFIYPVLTDGLLTQSQYQSRMWFNSWP